MVRATPSPVQNFASSVVMPVLGLALLPISLVAVAICLLKDLLLGEDSVRFQTKRINETSRSKGTVMISGGRMAKGLT
jgi:hypothetical protein